MLVASMMLQLFLLVYLGGSVESGSEVRLQWDACEAPFKLPEGFVVECAQSNHPLYYDDRRRLYLGRPVKVMTRRYRSPLDVKQLAMAESRRLVYWLIAGGPGSEAEDIERAFGASYLQKFAAKNATVYFLNHRGTHRASPLPTLSRFSQTVNRAEELLKRADSWVRLDAMLPTEAAHDFASIIEAAMLEDMDCEHYLHGFSYGGYLALEVASILTRPDHADAYVRGKLKGLVIDSGLPVDFAMNRDLRSDHELLEGLMKNCEGSFYCRNFTSLEILKEGFQAFLQGENCCAQATQRILLTQMEGNGGGASLAGDALRQLISQLLDVESQEIEVILNDTKMQSSSSPSDIHAHADGRIMAVQFLTHLSTCKDSGRFAELFLVIGRVLELQNVSEILKEMGLLSARRRPHFFFHETKQRSATRSLGGRHRRRKAKDIGAFSTDPLQFNYLLYANIIFTRFWDYSRTSQSEESFFSTNQLASSFMPSMQKATQEYASVRPPLQSPPLIRFAPDATLRVLVMAGGLDSRLCLAVMQRLYDSVPTSQKSMIIFNNRSHIVIGRLSPEVDDCPSRVLQSFFLPTDSSSQHDLANLERDCVRRENRQTLDWCQKDLKIAELHFWETSHANWMVRLCFSISKLFWAYPIWTVVFIGFILLLLCLMATLSIAMLRLRSKQRLKGN